MMQEFLKARNITESNSLIHTLRFAITGAAVGGSASLISTPFEMVRNTCATFKLVFHYLIIFNAFAA